MPGERFPHIFLAGPDRTEPFTNPRHGGPDPRIPIRDRIDHSTFLRQRFEEAWLEDDQRRAVAHTDRHGVYLDFVSEPRFDLTIKSLERVKSGFRLLNVRQGGAHDAEQTTATVFVPHAQRGFFLEKVRAYAEENVPKSGNPKNAPLIDSVSDIRRSLLESFWLDAQAIPGNDPIWIEIWLSSDNDEVIGRFASRLQEQQVQKSEGVIKFPERAVLVIFANRRQLEHLIEVSDDIAELRAAKEVASFYIEIENREQAEQVSELLARTRFSRDGDVVVTILDSGVNNGHSLIRPVLDNVDCHTVMPEWGTHDHDGHGTLMAGTAAFGDLLAILNSEGRVSVTHRLESAKILPPPPAQNLKKLWGYITAQGLARAEIQAPARKRVTCLAVTSIDGRDRGRPSSWSASIDAISSGHDDNIRRLFVISAGNTHGSDEFRTYPASNLTNEVHDPGQSWNALTVGAFTEKTRIVDPTLRNYSAIAPSGGLSPFSTTSTDWERRKWPLKPDVVFEGGNVAKGPNDSVQEADDLQLLSTYYDPQVAQFSAFNATSAAAAQASWMAAVIQTRYPNMWPETIRALMVHTAEWTDAMRGQFLPDQPSKADFATLLRICGYGVPNLDRALYCASNSLTLVGQAELQPYDTRDSRRVTKDMHFYKLPWPMEILRDLGGTMVKMRVTLSYFVEPGPGEIGWQDRYRYASHALRFQVNGPGENEADFIRRINDQARDDGEHPGTVGPVDHWLFGDNTRNVGSVHSDIWQGRAVDLALSNLIGVYPAVGWWRERHHLGRVNRRTRYSLLVSIQAPEQTVDIYTPVAIQVGIAVPVAIPVA